MRSRAVRQLRRAAATRLPDRREGILGSASIKLNANWVATGAARYDIDASKFDQTRFGVGYIDDCFILALNYITSYTYSGNPDAGSARHAAD